MQKRLTIGVAIALLLLALGFVLVSSRKPPVSIAWIQVLDESGRPVQAATIAPDGLRPEKGGCHDLWSSGLEGSGLKPTVVQTDSDGYARVRYPFYVEERLETGEISFAVDHPDFCPDRPFRVVASSPPANAPLREK